MFGREFNRIMKEQPVASLSVHEELGIITAKVNTTNLLLQRLHTHGSKEESTSKKETRN